MSYQIPICMSGYEHGDTTCNGDPTGKTEGDRRACAWRDRCAAFTRYLHESGQTVGDFLTQKTVLDDNGNQAEYLLAHDFDEFMAKVDGLMKTNGKKGSAPKAEKQKAPKPQKPKIDKRKHNHPSRKAKAASKQALRRIAKERRAEMRAMFGKFRQIIADGLPDYKWSGPREAIAPGRLFVMDRLKPSKYMSVYCKSLVGRDVPLALFRAKPQRMLAEVELPAEPEAYSNAARAKLKPIPVDDGGKFKSRLKKLDQEGLAVAAEALLRFIEQGHIKLPPPRRRGPSPA